MVLANGSSLGSADPADNNQEAVLSEWRHDGSATWSVIGLKQPYDFREKLPTSAATVYAAIFRAMR